LKILYVNHYAGSTRHGMEFRPFYLSRDWVRAGHEVLIVAASYSHVRAVQPEMEGPERDEVIDGVRYRWYRTPTYSGNSLGRIRNMLSFLRNINRDAARLADEFRPDIVIASSTYPMDIWPCRRIARHAKARLVFEVHDLWPLTPMQLGGMSRWHPFIMLVQSAEDYAYRHADKVVSLLPKADGYMRSRGMDGSKFVYVPNGIDDAEWRESEPLPEPIKVRMDAIRARGLPLVGYAGTHGLANSLDLLLDAARLLQGTAQIVMIGGGPERDRLLRRVADETLDNVSMLPPIPKRSIQAFLEAVDIAFMAMMPEPLYEYGIAPNKLVDYMMSGRPIVFSVKSGNDPVAAAGCGITVPPGNPAAIAEAVRMLSALPAETRLAMGASGRRFILENQTYRVLAERFLQQVCPVIDGVE
jgi:glycosyltransferase involved in cell wall biosynthesis